MLKYCKMLKLFLIVFLVSNVSFAQKPDLFLLKNYDESREVVGWVMSEKLDGIRAYWDGKKLWSRGGKEINAPLAWRFDFPPFAIDGELWTKRGDLEKINSIVRKKKANRKEWKKVSFNIFEVPKQQGGLLDRLEILEKYLKRNPSKYIRIIEQKKINKKEDLQYFLKEVVAKKGEGVVVRNPQTEYKTGRLKSALKVKKHYDTECTIIKILEGKGKYVEQMGSVECELANGKIVRIGSGFSDEQRKNPPKIGALITFKYYGFTKKGKHKFAVFLRERKLF